MNNSRRTSTQMNSIVTAEETVRLLVALEGDRSW